jgi:hypothetical protein
MKVKINKVYNQNNRMKLYEKCFDYRLSAEDCYYDGDWDTELSDFKTGYNPDEDFMEQLSQHNLFILLCMLDLTDDEYVDKCCDIQSDVVDLSR